MRRERRGLWLTDLPRAGIMRLQRCCGRLNPVPLPASLDSASVIATAKSGAGTSLRALRAPVPPDYVTRPAHLVSMDISNASNNR